MKRLLGFLFLIIATQSFSIWPGYGNGGNGGCDPYRQPDSNSGSQPAPVETFIERIKQSDQPSPLFVPMMQDAMTVLSLPYQIIDIENYLKKPHVMEFVNAVNLFNIEEDKGTNCETYLSNQNRQLDLAKRAEKVALIAQGAASFGGPIPGLMVGASFAIVSYNRYQKAYKELNKYAKCISKLKDITTARIEQMNRESGEDELIIKLREMSDLFENTPFEGTEDK